MRLALIPLNPTVGDLAGNAALIESRLDEARRGGATLALLPELAISGYPPKDLLLVEDFVRECERRTDALGRALSAGLVVVIGHPRLRAADEGAPAVMNTLSAYLDGKRIARYDKRLLPTYDVFDEDRYFEPGSDAVVFEAHGRRVGLAVCEDLWGGHDAGFSARYQDTSDPIAELAAAGAELVVSPSASPFVLGKAARHREILAEHARCHGLFMASINQLGGNDDLIFDGHAAVFGPDGQPWGRTPAFSEDIVWADLDAPRPPALAGERSDEARLFEALRLGVRDYLGKTGFRSALLGLSGGIDSAVTAAIAAAAIGPEAVTGIALPGKYSSEHSIDDARELAERLGLPFDVLPIAAPFDGCREALDGSFERLGHAALGASLPDLAEENLQARVRGTLLMALSNRSGAMLLTTGNKSELAVGYCTLYGDMNGGLAVLSDVSKQLVYRLARAMNDDYAAYGFRCPPIPENTITKPPSAELAPDQRDQDSLPPYDVLDEIIERHVERRQLPAQIVAETGFDTETVARITRLIAQNEYKRRQAASGLKVTSVAFGPGRRMPIAQRFRP